MFISILIYLFFWVRETKDPRGLYLWLSKMHLALYKRYSLNTNQSEICIDMMQPNLLYYCFVSLCRHRIVSFSYVCRTWKFIMRFVNVIIFVIILMFVIWGTYACSISVSWWGFILQNELFWLSAHWFVGCQWSTKPCWSEFAN